MNLTERLSLPVRLGGPGSGPVARLRETREGVVCELWEPSSESWQRDRVDLSEVMQAPPAEPGLLVRAGIPPEDGGLRLRDLLGLPLRTGGPGVGPVARFTLTPEGVVSETWVPGEGWVRGLVDADRLLVAPRADRKLLDRLGIPDPDTDHEEVGSPGSDEFLGKEFSRIVRQLHERFERFREKQREIWEGRGLRDL